MNAAEATHLTLLPDAPMQKAQSLERPLAWTAMTPELEQKIAELQARTICYNRELLRIAREMNEVRSAAAVAR